MHLETTPRGRIGLVEFAAPQNRRHHLAIGVVNLFETLFRTGNRQLA